MSLDSFDTPDTSPVPLGVAPVIIGVLAFFATIAASFTLPAVCAGSFTQPCALGFTFCVSAVFAVVGLWVCHTLRSHPADGPR